jgi:hypothetical protein
MLANKPTLFQLTSRFLRLLVVVLLVSGCTMGTAQPQTVTPDETQAPAGPPMAEIAFTVELPAELNAGQSLYLEVLDEVTGLALNPARVKMEAVGGRTYTVKIPFVLGSVIKYRYIRDNDAVGSIEYTSRGQQVRYRLYQVIGPGVVTENISAWRSVPFQVTAGRIQGQVSVAGSNSPVVNALVAAGGLHTFTASDGTFLLEGLPPGTHNMVVYSLDGAFRTFQQGALVAPDSTTPAQIQVDAAQQVNVTFVVRPPANHLQGVPVRLVGNTFGLGNTFSDLRGGASVVASRAPIMAVLPDGSYSLTIRLPVGSDLRYKYTLGDGFWNAELQTDGGFRLRQLIVPEKDVTIQDVVETWVRDGVEPVSFTVTTPNNTPASDTISIQFNPYGWTEPIPMWPLGNHRWFYVLYSPLHLLSQASYRYCRNEQCGSADAIETAGPNGTGKPFSSAAEAHKVEDAIQGWAWLDEINSPVIVSASEVKVRGEGFMAAIELAPGYHPSWQPYMSHAFKNIKDIGANTVILSPSWRFTQMTPPVIEGVPGQDPFWGDITQMINQAAQVNLNVVVHPVIVYNENPAEWWQSAARTEGWWQSWFDRYRTFLLYHADLAAQMGAKAFILNDDHLQAALPGGTLPDGSPSGVPGDAGERWTQLITDVRGRFPGQLIWMVPMTGTELPVIPDFVTEFDQVYVRVSAPLSEAETPTVPALEAAFSELLDSKILPLQEKTKQPVVLGLQYPSSVGAAQGCVRLGESCLPAHSLYLPAQAANGAKLAPGQQADIYSAALSVVNQRSWISGFVSSGYYPPVALKDNSYSVRLKPAADVLWYWFPRMSGK